MSADYWAERKRLQRQKAQATLAAIAAILAAVFLLGVLVGRAFL
jgi:hypothetical protein